MGSGGRAAREGWHHAKLQLKRGGMQGQRPHSRADGHKRFARVLLYPTCSPQLSCHPQEGWWRRASMASTAEGRTGFPLCGYREGEAAQVLPPTEVRKQRKGMALTIQHPDRLHHHKAQVEKSPAAGTWAQLWAPLGGHPTLTPSWCPPALASELPVEHRADRPDLTGVSINVRGLLPTASPAQRHHLPPYRTALR